MLLNQVYGMANCGPAKFILLEGINGAGKSTMIKMLGADLSTSREVFITAEPSRSSFGRIIRGVIDGSFVSRRLFLEAEDDLASFWEGGHSGFCSGIHVILEFLQKHRGQLSEAERQKLFVADRLMHLVEEVIIKLMIHHAWVLQDRYDISSYCHGMANGFSFERNLSCHQAALRELYLAPDIIFYLWIPVGLAVERLTQSGKVIDLYESTDTLRKVEMAARQLLGFVGEQPKPGKYLEREFAVLGVHRRIFIINAESNEKEVFASVRKLID